MKKMCLAVVLAASAFALAETQTTDLIKYGRAVSGETISVLFDGHVEHVFAGKLGFADANHSWTSVCGNIRAPISEGQFFEVHPMSTKSMGGGYERAGNIVHRFFNQATTPMQCAALQIAVWEAIEVGGDQPNFFSGDFQVRADPGTMALAQQYYQNAGTGGDAFFLQAGGQGGGGDAAGGQAGAGAQAGGGAGQGGGQSQLSP